MFSNGLAVVSAYKQAVIAASQLERTSSLVPDPVLTLTFIFYTGLADKAAL